LQKRLSSHDAPIAVVQVTGDVPGVHRRHGLPALRSPLE
jgi:hypothetical protein